MTALSEQRKEWREGKARVGTLNRTKSIFDFLSFFTGDEENMDTTEPIRQPVFDDVTAIASEARNVEKGSRKNRLAALASSIQSWEDDLSHPNIKADQEPKRKVWKAPTAPADTTSNACFFFHSILFPLF